jgi:hypothetical protein
MENQQENTANAQNWLRLLPLLLLYVVGLEIWNSISAFNNYSRINSDSDTIPKLLNVYK